MLRMFLFGTHGRSCMEVSVPCLTCGANGTGWPDAWPKQLSGRLGEYLEGSFLIGIASIIFSLAIAIIPFIAKRIVTGDVGSTAAAMIGTAVTALTVGAAAVEGAAAGLAAGGGGAAAGTSASGGPAGATAGSARTSTASAGANQPTPCTAESQIVCFGEQTNRQMPSR